jgi:hypothetical protein
MKIINVGKESVRICEHQGDINYLRFVKFKQWSPQIWEKMDSPVFSMHFEKYMDLYNQGKHAQACMIWYDYKLAIEQKDNVDAWGMCFALISGLEGEDIKGSCPDDAQLKSKIEKLNTEGLTAAMVREGVINFMTASPVDFAAHLMLHVAPSMKVEA